MFIYIYKGWQCGMQSGDKPQTYTNASVVCVLNTKVSDNSRLINSCFGQTEHESPAESSQGKQRLDLNLHCFAVISKHGKVSGYKAREKEQSVVTKANDCQHVLYSFGSCRYLLESAMQSAKRTSSNNNRVHWRC